MPYADPDVQREFNRQLFAVRYRTDPEFREDESYRKAKWYQKHRERVIAHVREARYQKRRDRVQQSHKKSTPKETRFEREVGSPALIL